MLENRRSLGGTTLRGKAGSVRTSRVPPGVCHDKSPLPCSNVQGRGLALTGRAPYGSGAAHDHDGARALVAPNVQQTVQLITAGACRWTVLCGLSNP